MTLAADMRRVTPDGPNPRPNWTSKLAAVRAAPRVSGGLTLSRHGRTLTAGSDATNPHAHAQPIPDGPRGLANGSLRRR